MTKLTKFLKQNDIILAVAERVSEKYPDVSGKCERISKELANELKKYGVNAKHVVGNFTLDEPDAEKYMGCTDMNVQDEYEVNHDWVEIEGRILDITAKQFRKSVSENIPDILYIRFSDPLHARYRFLNNYGDN